MSPICNSCVLEPVRERYGAEEIPETPMARDYMDADGLEGVPLGLFIRKATKRQVFVQYVLDASDTFNFGNLPRMPGALTCRIPVWP